MRLKKTKPPEVRKLTNGLQIIKHESGREFLVPDPKPHPAPKGYYQSMAQKIMGRGNG